MCHRVIVRDESHERAVHMQISTIGIDLAKNVFQVHGVDAAEKLVLKKQLRRSQVLEFFSKLSPCLVGMEACATSHQWARELKKFGHDVRLMPASYVKAYVKRGKNDAADAAAICEAVTRPSSQAYSALMFAALMIGHHFSISAFWRARSASGVCCSRGKISCPRFKYR
jgi:Transposase